METEPTYQTQELPEPPESVSNSVESWAKKIRDAREHWDKDFKRMRSNMEFAAGFQWAGQTELDDDRYIANMTLRLTNQKVANLYAKDPKFIAKRRKRLDFQMWDGRMESLEQASAIMAAPPGEVDDATSLSAAALTADFTQGRQYRDLVDRVGSTLEHVFSWQIDNQMPSFKVQMKQLVRRVVVAGVGYMRLNFSREYESTISTSDAESSVVDRAKKAQEIINRLEGGELEENSKEMVELASLFESMKVHNELGEGVSERLVFDFPPATSIIPDKQTRNLRGFVGARWLAQEFIMPIEEINAFFETNIKTGGKLKDYGTQENPVNDGLNGRADSYSAEKPLACLWEVFDLDTKCSFFICDGWHDYVQEPKPVMPRTKHFWPVFALTFNDLEIEPDRQKASIFPPSDVQISKSAQKEWNRTRQSLRKQRMANAPKYMTGKGWLTDEDKEMLINAEENAVIELQGAQPDTNINNLLSPFRHSPIDPMAYDTNPLTQDLLSTLGNEENTQPSSSKGTATAATINEQARLVVTSSNIDDLDDFLSDVAEAGGEILINECSIDTVKRIAGPGAVWPEGEQKGDFANFIQLQVIAASSGRPNKALELANFQQIAPTLIAAGANPHFIVREAIKRLDDRLDVDEAFPFGTIQSGIAMPANQKQEKSSTEPSRGSAKPERSGQMPAGTQPRSRVERPQV